MDKISKVKSELYFGISMTIFFILQDLMTHDNLTTKRIIIAVVFGTLGGAISGLLFGWLMQLFLKSKLFTLSTKINIDANETIVFETGANHFKGAEGVGGKLYLTNKRLVFRSHKFNIQNHELSINISELYKVKRHRTMGIVNNGLSVITTYNTIERFAVQQPDNWMNQLAEKNGLDSKSL